VRVKLLNYMNELSKPVGAMDVIEVE